MSPSSSPNPPGTPLHAPCPPRMGAPQSAQVHSQSLVGCLQTPQFSGSTSPSLSRRAG